MAEPKIDSLVDPTFLFRFQVPLAKVALDWSQKGLQLPDKCQLPSFGEMANRPVFADVRMGWNKTGIGIQVLVKGKRQMPWCRDTRLDESDGIHVWIDTRCSPGIHRATQFCHRFLWMPVGGGPRRDRPIATLVPINRARQNPKSIPSDGLKIAAAPKHDGYALSGFISASALTGFSPEDQPRIGLYYAVVDRELGWQTFSLGPDYPVVEDPSLWGEAVLS